MKRNPILITLIFIFLMTSCQNNENKEIEKEKNKLLSQYNKEEVSILEEIVSHQDNGYYTYTSKNLENGEIIQKLSYGIDAKKNIEIEVLNENFYTIKNNETLTVFDIEKNLYYQNEKAKRKDFGKVSEDKKLSLYNELMHKGKFKMEKNKDDVKLSFDNGSYDIYDKKTYDLKESIFISGGEKVIKKLDSKDSDVEKYYNNFLLKIQNMEKVDSLNELTGKI